MRGIDGTVAGRGDFELPARPTPANGERGRDARRDEPLVLEPLERGVYRADRVVMPGPRRDVGPNGQPMCVVPETGDGEEHGEFERAEGRGGHVLSCRTNQTCARP